MHESQPILALLIYGKNERSDLSPDQRKMAALLAPEMKHGARQWAKAKSPISAAT